MLFGPPLALLISLVGVFVDRSKAFAIAGLVISVGTCGLYLVPMLLMLASRV